MASKRHQKRAAERVLRKRRCDGKKVYDSLAAARFDAAYLSRTQRKHVEAYTCVHCGAIHVGHRPYRAKPCSLATDGSTA